jgi:hypothetical protein
VPLGHPRHPARSYHDRQGAAKMKQIGLQPVTTGEPGGKETGQSFTYYILPGGPDAKACAKPKAKGFQLHWTVGASRATVEGKEG